MFAAIEYVADGYISAERPVPEDLIAWQQVDPIPTSHLIDLLVRRGWHLTDVGDALHEARTIDE